MKAMLARELEDKLRLLIAYADEMASVGDFESAQAVRQRMLAELSPIADEDPEATASLERVLATLHAVYPGYCDFVTFVVQVHGHRAVMSFLQEAFSPSGLASQFQRLLRAKHPVPRWLHTRPLRLTAAGVHRRIALWRTVAADWEQLTRVPYGLLSLAQRSPRSWDDTGRVALADRVRALEQVPNLADLAHQDWVTVRNAIDHGRELYQPTASTVEFRDRAGTHTLGAFEVHDQLITMANANAVMLLTGLLVVDGMQTLAQGWP